MLTYADAWRLLTQQVIAHNVCWRMLTYADVCLRMLTYADTWRMLTQQVVAHTVVEAHRPDLVISFLCVGGFGEACMCIVSARVAYVWMKGLFFCISMRRLRAWARLLVCTRMLTYDDVCYVSIRQHTSAYVSIRQHTSAYVSIRQQLPCFLECTHATFLVNSFFPDMCRSSYTYVCLCLCLVYTRVWFCARIFFIYMVWHMYKCVCIYGNEIS